MNYSAVSSQSSSHTSNRGGRTDGSAWHLYREALVRAHIKQHCHSWYARHAQRFLANFAHCEINLISEAQVEQHFESIPATWFKHDWQQAQYIDAVRILICEIYQLPWASDFPWANFTSSARTLTNDHCTLAREAIHDTPNEPQHSGHLTPEHTNLLQLLSRSLRENNYAIRTEKTYCHWVQRFLLAVADTPSPAEPGNQQVKDFLSNLVLGRNISKSTQNVALNALVFF